MSKKHNIDQFIDEAFEGIEEAFPTYTFEPSKEYLAEKLDALLLAVQDEQIMKCRINANQYFCSHDVDRAIADTEYAYNPNKETA